MVKCEAFRFKSGDHVYYFGLLKAKYLLSAYKVDAYDVNSNEEGYQRKIIKSRAKKFASYLVECKGSLNGALLLNIRGQKGVTFKRKFKNSQVGDLEVDSTLYVVDGQHRIMGLEIAINEMGYSPSTLVPIIISLNRSKNLEALSFLVVNRTAKGIRADLTDELIYKTIPTELLTDNLKKVLGLKIQRSIGSFTLDVTKGIAAKKDSIWYERIAMPEQSKSGGRLIGQKAFSDALAIAIKSSSTLKRASNLGDLDSVVKWLNLYWNAISKICPVATSVEEAKKYTLMKTQGVSIMNRLFSRVLDDCGEDPSFDGFIKSLQKMDSLADYPWLSKKGKFANRGSNKVAQDRIYEDLEYEFDTYEN